MHLIHLLIYYDVNDWLILSSQKTKTFQQAQQDLIAIIQYHLYREYHIQSDCISINNEQQQLFVRLQHSIRLQMGFIGHQSIQKRLTHCQCTITANADLCVDLFNPRANDESNMCTESNS